MDEIEKLHQQDHHQSHEKVMRTFSNIFWWTGYVLNSISGLCAGGIIYLIYIFSKDSEFKCAFPWGCLGALLPGAIIGAISGFFVAWAGRRLWDKNIEIPWFFLILLLGIVLAAILYLISYFAI